MALRVGLISSHGLPGIAAATMFDTGKDMSYCDSQLRVAFDGDSLLFSEEMEYSTKEHGLEKFFQHEAQCETKPIVQVGSRSSN